VVMLVSKSRRTHSVKPHGHGEPRCKRVCVSTQRSLSKARQIGHKMCTMWIAISSQTGDGV